MRPVIIYVIETKTEKTKRLLRSTEMKILRLHHWQYSAKQNSQHLRDPRCHKMGQNQETSVSHEDTM